MTSIVGSDDDKRVNVLMIGTGEYTTGFVGGGKADSDKGAGVVGIVMFDLRRRGKVGKLGLVGTNGKKMPQIRQHMENNIGKVYKDMDLTCSTFPADGTVDREAYLKALDQFSPGDAVTIFTPDNTHCKIALAAIERGLHVLVTKPPVKELHEHKALVEAAKRKNVLVLVEVHKRYDPMYVDARDRISNLGDFSYMNAYMSQPKHQLDTFRAWAGKSSDISYYLNSHHVDFLEWAIRDRARPVRVSAFAADGVAKSKGIETEDTITLNVTWKNLQSGSTGISVFTSSWIAPKSDVHSQQRFFYMGHKGEVRIDQAHRGFNVATDDNGFASCNPLFMKYTPSDGFFSGQNGYGYKSFETFIDAVQKVNAGKCKPEYFDGKLPTITSTLGATAILEAGRRSLDSNGQPYDILYENEDDINAEPVALKAVVFS